MSNLKLPANVGVAALVKQDERFGDVKLFNKFIETPVAVSESGFIGIYQPAHKKQVKPPALGGLKPAVYEDVPEELTVIHISQVNGFELLVDKKKGVGGAIAGGLLFGGGGAIVGQTLSRDKAKSIDLQIKTSDFQHPQIVVPLYRYENAISGSMLKSMNNSMNSKQREQEIQELVSSLDNLLQNAQKSPKVTVQQTSDADELVKFKKLLDDGVITQDEFDAKKKQLLGL